MDSHDLRTIFAVGVILLLAFIARQVFEIKRILETIAALP